MHIDTSTQSNHIKVIDRSETGIDNFVEIHVSGKLDKTDYEVFVPRMELIMREHDVLRMLVVLEEFEGWTAGGLWEDIKFDTKHYNDVERLAIVGDKKWHEMMSKVCKPFTTAEVRYYPLCDLETARGWLQDTVA